MMKMSGRITSCCVALLLTFTTVSAVQRVLRSINDLNKDSCELLRWFASTVDIDRNCIIRLTFDPNSGDYGSHHYGNFEGLLDQLPRGYRYYTLGNINQRTSLQVPSHRRNKARLIIRIREQNAGRQSQIIDQIYITQHYQRFDYQRSEYDPDQTYQIPTSVLREIRGFPMAIHHNPTKYRANNFGSANNPSYWTLETCRLHQEETSNMTFCADKDRVPDWLLAVVVFFLFIAVCTLLNLATANKN